METWGSGLDTNADSVLNYVIQASVLSVVFIVIALVQLNRRILDRARSAGVMTHQMSRFAQRFRMILYMEWIPRNEPL